MVAVVEIVEAFGPLLALQMKAPRWDLVADCTPALRKRHCGTHEHLSHWDSSKLGMCRICFLFGSEFLCWRMFAVKDCWLKCDLKHVRVCREAKRPGLKSYFSGG